MKICLSILTLSILILVVAAPSYSQWAELGVGICELPYAQGDIAMIPDGTGGAIITWSDSRNGGVSDIYAQRIDIYGNTLWTANGVAVCAASGYQYAPQLVSDGAGGVIIAWRDDRGSDPDVYAQRLDGDGNALWPVNGMIVSAATGGQYEPQICSDRAGGAIMVWKDMRDGNTDVYAQRMDNSGNPVWTVNGSAVCTQTSPQYDPVIASEISGGAVIAWRDYRNGNYDIYAQRVSASGTGSWGFNGVAVCTETGTQQTPGICSDGTYGAIISWMDARGADSDIYAQRIDGSGFSVWTYQGTLVCGAATSQYYPVIESDGMFGAYIAWYDNRGVDSDIYIQRVSGIGAMKWISDGELVCDAASNQMGTQIAVSEDGLLVSWKDSREGITNVFLQKLDTDGNGLWAANGIAASPFNLGAVDQKVVTDGAGGAITVWEQYTISNSYDMFAQRIERNGYWGYPAPAISAIRDVPGDEGGFINVAWDASRLDPWPEESISEYTVWRAIDEEAALAFAASGGAILMGTPAEMPGSAGPMIRMEKSASGEYYWLLISTIAAHQFESYSDVVPSLFDSTAVCTENHYFQVIAYSATPGEYWISAPDSGYSVDNLSPCPPLALAGEQFYTPEGLALTWEPNDEPDLGCYRIYRGTDEFFVPGIGSLLIEAEEAEHFDDTWTWEAGYYYKLSAVDVHGNESGFALLGPGAVTGDDPVETPVATYLSQNYPNPFNPVTTIEFGLSEAGPVSLRIYDAAGRLVRVILNDNLPAAHYSEGWDGKDGSGIAVSSGVYFYRLSTKTFAENRKMILLR